MKVKAKQVERRLPNGKCYTRNDGGELLAVEAYSKFKKPYPLPEPLKAVAVEIMGGVDPLDLTPDERIKKLEAFFNIIIDRAPL